MTANGYRSPGPRPAKRPVCATCITVARHGGLANYAELGVELARAGVHLCSGPKVDSNVVVLLSRFRAPGRLQGRMA